MLAPLGKAPDWSVFDGYQNSITRGDFERLLTTVYAMPQSWSTTLFMEESQVKIRRESAKSLLAADGTYDLKFGSAPATAQRFWRKRAELPPLANPERPLEGVKIALDPGHIGGNWAVMEERNFQPESGPPVREGELTLITARLLQTMLMEQGATVFLVRNRNEPVTDQRPKDFVALARQELTAMGIEPDNPPNKSPINTVRWQSEKLFYRTAEIRARAKLVNESMHPDVVVCLHFNASGSSWGAPGKPNYSDQNHLHILINGGFGLDELVLDDQRQEMLLKLLGGVHEEELGLAVNIADSLASTTGLPPFIYQSGAVPMPASPYVWGRNLLANRLYSCPVVYCEPFVMNNKFVAVRLQEGDYEGQKEIGGVAVGSIFREYAEGVAAGLKKYFSGRR